MKILHFADMHLGVRLSAFNKNAVKFIKEDTEKVFIKLKKMISTEQYDGLIMAGDIFDNINISPYYIKFIEDISRILLDRGAFVVFASGNHDYWINEKHFKNLLKYEKFVFFTEEKVQKKEIVYLNKKIAFYGISYKSKNPARSLSFSFPEKSDEDIAIGVLHGDVYENTEVLGKYYSVSAKELKTKNYDYFALGHLHSYNVFYENIAYPGSTFAYGMDEIGEKVILSVDINEDKIEIEKKSMSSFIVKDMKVDLLAKNKWHLLDKLKVLLEKDLEETSLKFPKKIIYRLSGLISDFDDYLSNDDLEFKTHLFSNEIASLSTLNFKFNHSSQTGYEIPILFQNSIKEAIEEISFSDVYSNSMNKLSCNLNTKDFFEEYDFYSEVLNFMRLSNEN